MPTQWYFVENGKRPGERIIATYNKNGKIHKVAAAFLDKYGYIYNVYPVSYKGYATIKKRGVLSIREVELQGYKK